ncbi:MAG: FkbM family methyltransferase [Ginsengibacter sp.]
MRLFIRKILQRFGYDIVKYNPPYVLGAIDMEDLEREYSWLRSFDFKTILDIGANEGQFADKMHTLFPETIIHSFEPIAETFALLQKNFENIKQLKAINLALGDFTGEVSFNKNEYSPSSSLLTMSQKHVQNFDYAVKTNPITVKMDRLDNVLDPGKLDLPLLIKIDVQGFEDKVIKGGMEVIKKADLILCEVSFTELYKGQSLFADIYEMFKNLGYTYAGSVEQLRSPETNLILQADAVFIKAN